MDKHLNISHSGKIYMNTEEMKLWEKEITTYPHESKYYPHIYILIRKEAIFMKVVEGHKSKDSLDVNKYSEYNRRDIPKYPEENWETNSFIR